MGRRPFLRMAVRRDSRVRGGRCRGGGDWGHREEDRLSQDEKQD